MEREIGVAGRGYYQLRTKHGNFLIDNGIEEMVRCRGIRAPKNAPTVSHMYQALGNAPMGVEVILMINLNARTREPCDTQEEELATVVVDCGLEDMTANFIPRRRYRGDGLWTWQKRREDR